MKKVKVAVYGTTGKQVEIPIGATVGENLFAPDGSIITMEMLFPPEDATQDPVLAKTTWSLILDIPANVTALEKAVGTGLFAVTGAGTGAFRTIQNGAGINWTNPGGVAGNPQAVFNSQTALVDRLAGSTYSTVQQFINTMHSPGTIDGPALGIVPSGIPATPIRVLSGKGMIRIADDDVSSLPFFDYAQTDFAQPSDGLTRFYGVVYNAGAPVVQQRMTYNWDKDTEIPLGSAVIFASGQIVITPNPYKTGDPITNIIQRFDAQSPAIRDASIGGLLIGETPVRTMTLSGPAKIWSRLSDFDVASKNSSTSPMLSAFFNGTGLTVTPALTQWDNARYNSVGTGTLVAMGANKYANLWFFISIDGTQWGFAYGTNEYNTLGAAANEGVPVYLNQNFFQQALLLGRLIFQQGAATASLIESAFTQLFNTAAVNNHNDLSGLQDAPNPAANEHYHLNSAQAATAADLANNTHNGPLTCVGDITASAGRFMQTGIVTTANNLVGVNGTNRFSTTGAMNVLQFQANIEPQQATTSAVRGMIGIASLTASASAVAEMDGAVYRIDSTAGFTGAIANAYGVRVLTPGLLTAPTNYFAFSAENYAAAATLNIGYRGTFTAAANKWNLYLDGTAQNYIQGNVGIGVAVAATKLHVVGNTTQDGARLEINVVSPAQIVANTDNWAVTGITTAAIIRANTDASRNLTGIASPTSGQMLRLINVGAQDLVLVHDATSTAANRFLLPNSANLTLNPNDSVSLWYDNTSSRWRALGV